jgi:hypothetical protein
MLFQSDVDQQPLVIVGLRPNTVLKSTIQSGGTAASTRASCKIIRRHEPKGRSRRLSRRPDRFFRG